MWYLARVRLCVMSVCSVRSVWATRFWTRPSSSWYSEAETSFGSKGTCVPGLFGLSTVYIRLRHDIFCRRCRQCCVYKLGTPGPEKKKQKIINKKVVRAKLSPKIKESFRKKEIGQKTAIFFQKSQIPKCPVCTYPYEWFYTFIVINYYYNTYL